MMKIFLDLVLLLYFGSGTAYVLYLFKQKQNLQKSGIILLLLGFLCQSLVIGLAILDSGQIPVRNLKETLCIASWAIAGVYLLFYYKYRLRILGIFAAPMALMVLAVSIILPAESIQPNAIFKSPWLLLHIVTIFTGEAALALACGVGFLYLLLENAIKNKKHGFFYHRLPSLEMLDSAGYACIVVGFSMMTVGLICGFVYAKAVWGRFVSWDPKEVWSGITWLIYAALIHERLTVGWRGRRSAIMAIIGFLVVLFTFLGVNFLLKGHHVEFTRW